jgi:uncharacterized protein (DUF2062 family)
VTPPTPSLLQQLRQSLPTREQLARMPLLGRLAGRLADRDLWRVRPESIARGAAVGVFWAFAVPVAQIVFAAVHCVWWRAHIPVAAGVTLITNPLTIGPWLVLAHEVGERIVGPGARAALPADAGWFAQLQALGWPTLVGMGSFAVGGALTAYLAVRLAAQARLAWRLRRRQGRRAA